MPSNRSKLSKRVREEILEEADYTCHYCGASEVETMQPFHVDHVHPVSKGGTNDRSNLVAACRACNMEKLDWTVDEWKAWREHEGLCWPPKHKTWTDHWREINDLIAARRETA